MTDPWGYWKSEITRVEAGGPPVPEDRHSDPNASIQGYWRVLAAKTKHDWPVLIFREPNPERNPDGLWSIQWGAGRPKLMTAEEVAEFENGTFLKCMAVRKLEWVGASERGQWPSDGKISRPTSTEEKHDIIPDTPASEGGNNPVDEETGEEVDAFWLQIKTKLEAQIEKAKPFGNVIVTKRAGKEHYTLKITKAEDAKLAAAIRDTIREIGALGEKKRVEEKTPHDVAAQAVQDKWVPVLKPASVLAAALLNGIDEYQREEQRKAEEAERERVRKETAERLERERQEREAERERVRLETEERLRREAAEAANKAAEQGDPAPFVPADEDIRAQAAQTAAETVAVPTDDDIAAQAQQAAAEAPVEVAKPVVQGSAFSRATSRAKVARGKIVDLGKLAAHFVEQKDEDFIAYLQKRVDGAYRVKLTLPGTEADNG